MTFMIPGFKGNSSNYNIGAHSETYKTLIDNGVPRKNSEDFHRLLHFDVRHHPRICRLEHLQKYEEKKRGGIGEIIQAHTMSTATIWRKTCR